MQASDLAEPEAGRTFLSSRVRRPPRNLAGLEQALEVVRGWLEAAQLHERAWEKDLETYALIPGRMKTEASMAAWRLLCAQEQREFLEELQRDLEHEYIGLLMAPEHSDD